MIVGLFRDVNEWVIFKEGDQASEDMWGWMETYRVADGWNEPTEVYTEADARKILSKAGARRVK